MGDSPAGAAHKIPPTVPTVQSFAGVVAEFEDYAGLGVVALAAGDRYPFHCTAVADGSRHIDVGAAVRFALAPGHLGRLEARDLAPCEPGGGQSR